MAVDAWHRWQTFTQVQVKDLCTSLDKLADKAYARERSTAEAEIAE